MYQPLDQGAIAGLKFSYKSHLLARIVALLSLAGLDYGNPAHVKDAANLIQLAWTNISSSTISACWTRSGCLPAIYSTAVTCGSRQYHKQLMDETLEAMCSCFSKLSLSDPSVASALEAMGLADTAKGGERVYSILSQWLLEEELTVNVEKEDGDPDGSFDEDSPGNGTEANTDSQNALSIA